MKLWASILIFATSVLIFAQDSTNGRAKIVLDKNVAVPMRDGVILRADVLRPSGGGKFPVLVYRTPYGKDVAQREYTTFERALGRGYAVVVQDVPAGITRTAIFVHMKTKAAMAMTPSNGLPPSPGQTAESERLGFPILARFNG